MSKTKNFRLGKTDTARYGSLEDLRTAWGLKPVIKRTNDENKLAAQKEKFLGACKVCGQPLVYNGGNILTCNNVECKGIKHSSVNEETGEEKIWYTPIYRILDDLGEEIATNLFMS